MSIISRTRHSIASHVVEWRRRARGRAELRSFGDRNLADLPFGRTEAQLEANKWFWQR